MVPVYGPSNVRSCASRGVSTSVISEPSVSNVPLQTYSRAGALGKPANGPGTPSAASSELLADSLDLSDLPVGAGLDVEVLLGE